MVDFHSNLIQFTPNDMTPYFGNKVQKLPHPREEATANGWYFLISLILKISWRRIMDAFVYKKKFLYMLRYFKWYLIVLSKKLKKQKLNMIKRKTKKERKKEMLQNIQIATIKTKTRQEDNPKLKIKISRLCDPRIFFFLKNVDHSQKTHKTHFTLLYFSYR